jgi:hypothetical protein
MTSEPRLPKQTSGRSSMPRACHEHIWLGASNLPARKRETKAVKRAPLVSNAAMAAKTSSRPLGLLPAAASNTPIPTENSIG